MNNNLLKRTAVASLALLTLAGGATSAFADSGKGNGKGNNGKAEKHVQQSGKGKIEINLRFQDEKELKWALEYVMRLASKGVFNGYEDGSFKPKQTITRIEALTAAVRLMGLRAQAESTAEMSTKLNFSDANLIEKKYPWAVGYVAVAAENDLFAETESAIHPNKPADRLWAATLLVKALKLDAEAKAKANTTLAFKDADKIPAGAVGYIAVALEKGLITGYEDNTFRPNRPVTRAELAALLDRTDSQLPDANNGQTVTGRVKAAVSGSTLVVTKADGTDATLTLDGNVFVFRGGVKAAPSAIAVGDTVQAISSQGRIVFIEVTQTAQPAPVVTLTEVGVVNNINPATATQPATISIVKNAGAAPQGVVLNLAAHVEVSGGTLADVTAGKTVLLQGANGTVTKITIVS